jgi:hypothetical protein
MQTLAITSVPDASMHLKSIRKKRKSGLRMMPEISPSISASRLQSLYAPAAVLDPSNSREIDSNPTRGMNVCASD